MASIQGGTRQILLLKTKSSPHDGYDEFFSAPARNSNPTFIPVLSHNFHHQNLQGVKSLFENGAIQPNTGKTRRYGGMIFTSQRAVEAFAEMVLGVEKSTLESSSRNLPLYTLGPATARSLTTLRDSYLPHSEIHGAETGNGENLARYILGHYNGLFKSQSPTVSQSEGSNDEGVKPPLLFLVGETRRDIIPRTLMGVETPPKKRIGVEEVVVYETGVVAEFEGDFERTLRGLLGDTSDYRGGYTGAEVIWVVVFSPTGCDAMVRVLKREIEQGEQRKRRVFVATIGPTTRDHLIKQCGFEPDVCAAKPSPEGVGAGIEEFMKGLESR